MPGHKKRSAGDYLSSILDEFDDDEQVEEELISSVVSTTTSNSATKSTTTTSFTSDSQSSFGKGESLESVNSLPTSPKQKRQKKRAQTSISAEVSHVITTSTPQGPSPPVLDPPACMPNITPLALFEIPTTEHDSEVTSSPSQSDLVMYLFDCAEKGESLYLFGKNEMGQSICVIVDNLFRTVFLLPRAASSNADTSQTNTERTQELAMEVHRLAKNQGIQNIKVKGTLVKRSYYFDDFPVPHGDYMFVKFVYPYSAPVFQLPSENKMFSHIFHSKQSALELLLLKRRLRMPCWVKIKNAKDVIQRSWCSKDYIIDDIKDISVLTNKVIPPPKFKVLSVKVKTVFNDKTQANEILAISCLYHDKFAIDTMLDNVDAELRKLNIIRPLDKAIPIVQDEETKKSYHLENDEVSLLNFFLGMIGRVDPDIIVGHNFLSFDLDVLLTRCASLGVRLWSKLGRLRLSIMPKLQGGAGGMSQATRAEKEVLSGRLLCDTYLAAVEHLKEKSNSLQTLAETQLGITDKQTLGFDLHSVHPYFTSQKNVQKFVGHVENDAYLSLMLMLKLALLPLTKELTSIAGNLWSKTLTGSRAERIEYLLLHEFYEKKFILPEKKQSFQKHKRKAAYAGGLVLEPIPGLYNAYVLLLDFNSLYPSIIREHNLCFLTVERKSVSQNSTESSSSESNIKILDKSHPNHQKAILPKIITHLINRRRDVKRLVENESDKNRKWILDLKQKALKLTANSTYGCLGFQYSRFFCQPIAETITLQGRVTLMNTKQEIEKLGFNVIYGDTDSVMILTSCMTYNEAMEVGHVIQKEINKKYKFLELGIDGLFRRILLLKKKKYAAVIHYKDPKNPDKILSKLENKGLDMVRRDWCDLSRNTCEYIVDKILNNEKGDEEPISDIHAYLRDVSDRVYNNEVKIEDFVITKQLTKAPEEYPDAKIHPHVQVASKLMDKGIPVKVGDRVPYVICIDRSKTMTSNTPASSRAYHPSEYEEAKASQENTLHIDYDWYVSQQIYPPVLRLCEHIDGTDAVLIAECLGLDKQFIQSQEYLDEYEPIVDRYDTFEEQKYRNVTLPISYNCPKCNQAIDFSVLKRLSNLVERHSSSVVDEEDYKFLSCNHCREDLYYPRVCNYVDRCIRELYSKYYTGWSVPENQQKQQKTRVYSLARGYGIIEQKLITVRPLFTDRQFLTHMQYLGFLFNVHKAEQKLNKHSKKGDEVKEVLERMQDAEEMNLIFKKISKQISKFPRQRVNLAIIFPTKH